MDQRLTVFIDEAGDPGVRDGLKYAPTRHEWLCLAAAVVRSSNEDQTLEWVKEMRSAARARQGGSLHYARITTERRRSVCSILATKPVRAFCVASHKTNVREHINPRLGHFDRSDKFYNWCVRLLLERISDWYAAMCDRDGEEIRPVRLVFAERGGHDYDHMFNYFDRLRMQIETDTLFLKGKRLTSQFLVRDEWAIDRAENLAGLQLADTVASAIYQAANTASPTWDVEPAKALKPIIAADKWGCRADMGLTVWPLPHQAEIPERSAPIFNFYGYRK